MTKPPTNSNISKSRALSYLEYILLAVCICVIALRTIVTEGPTMQSTSLPTNLNDSLYSLTISAFLIFSFVLWFVWSLCSKRFLYRLTGIEIGLGIFLIAAIVTGFAASDKRLVITNIAVFLAPLLMALLLVQILDSNFKIRLVLAVIAALGVLSACQCAEQFFSGNQMTIEQYEQNPQIMLEPLGIETGTFQHFLFEHRLYSRGVRAFFTTRNSAGSFLLMALFTALALSFHKFQNLKSDSFRLNQILAYCLVAGLLLFGLALTKSKGAILGLFSATAVFILLFLFGNWLKVHRKSVLVACLLLAIVGACGIAWYGLNHGRLPGGGSMLVRWQYWKASAKMYADHFLTGVGPGNFVHFYPHYKPAEALESVADPHNFLLSILTQYGIIGLFGFLTMIFLPLWKIISPNITTSQPEIQQRRSALRTKPIIFILILWVALLLAIHLVMPATTTDNLLVVIYMTLRFFIPHLVAFAVAFLLLTANNKIKGKSEGLKVTRNTTILLFCAVVGIVVHNLVDFAIFEPGVFTVFWTIIACIIAINFQNSHRSEFTFTPSRCVKIPIALVGVIIISVYLNYALIPVAKTTTKIQLANEAISAGRFEYAHKVLDSATNDDPLSPAAPFLNGKLYLHHFRLTSSVNHDLLLQAEKCLQTAIQRNHAAYKNFERLTEVYTQLADISKGQEKINWLNKAFDKAQYSVKFLYPGCARLRIELAKIAEQLGKTDIAIIEYKKAIEIEDSYRTQFQEMYPERKEIVSRVGEDKYLFAKKRLQLHIDQLNQ